MSKGEVSEKEWEKGVGNLGDKEREESIMLVIEGRRLSMKEISKRSGIKWVYSSVLRLVKLGKLERKKLGKLYYYREK